MLKRVLKNIFRTIFFCRGVPSAGEKFVTALEETHIKFVRLEYWQQDEIKWVYFMYLNLPLMLTLFFGGY